MIRARPSRPPVGLLVAALLAAQAAVAAADDSPCWPGPSGSDPAACAPNDPGYAGRWEFRSDIPEGIDRSLMHPAEVALGSIGMSVDRAWQETTGSPDVVIAVLDSGIRWNDRDLVRKLWLNTGELPPPAGSTTHDRDGNGVVDVRDYEGDPRVGDRNGNGMVDPEDLILAFSDCKDDDGNGYPDDICGYDFFGGSGACGLAFADNNPRDDTDFGHGTGIASTAAAETDNGIGDPGVCPRCRILPVRVGDSFVVDANQFARGLVYAVRGGATVVASALGSYNNTSAARRAVDLAWERGVPVIASAADEYSYHHNFPSVYARTLYVNAIRFNHASDIRQATTFWGVNPCTNYGARVWVTVPAKSCSSGATSRLAGVAGLMESMARTTGRGDLHAEEVYQVLRSTADDLDDSTPDWGGMRHPARPGFDQLYGYGRVHAHRAVLAVRAGDIPPIVDLRTPRWFSIVSPRRTPLVEVRGEIRAGDAAPVGYRLDWAVGVEPAAGDWVPVAQGTVDTRREGLLGVLDLRVLPLPEGPPPRDRNDRDRYSVSVRLRATDRDGRIAEARRSLFVLDDPTWVSHFPVELASSGEAAPLVRDLDGDGRDEIVLATADGAVSILRWEPSGIRRTDMLLDPGPPLFPDGDAAGGPRESLIRGPVAGDIHGNGRISIVVASREGKVYAFDVRGERVPGFPVALPALAAPPAKDRPVERGILSTPALADLDGVPGAEIVVTGLDGRLHAWSGNGEALDGFPVALLGAQAKIVSSPAVGDLDGDGRPEIVFGSNATSNGHVSAWAVRAGGTIDPAGPFVPGWDPLELTAVRAGLLPTIASGVQMDPALVDADRDGDVEAVLYGVTSSEIVLIDHGRDGPYKMSRFLLAPSPDAALRGMTFLAGTGSPLVVDTDGDEVPELYAPLLSLRLLTLRVKPGVPLDVPLALGGWDLGQPEATVRMLRTFPRRMEDLMLLVGPNAADADGDGFSEILMGSGGYLIHAFRKGGGEAEGFPKFTGGWSFSPPAVGDLDGDGTPELVAVTREGWLFAWRLAGASSADRPSAQSSPSARPTTRYGAASRK